MRRKFLALALTFAMCAAMSAETAHATSPATTSELPDGLESSVPVIVVGNYKFTSQFTAENDDQATTKASNPSVDYDDMITYVDSLSALPSRYAKSSDDAAAIVISQDVVDEYTSDGSGKTALEALLNTGNVAYFPETSYDEMSHIFGAITGDGFNMTPVEEGNSDQVTAYVLKDIKGNYYTGNIIAPDNAAQEAIDERILVETQENHSIYTTGRSTSDFEPGYEWNQISTWHKNSYAGEATGKEWLSEWICFYSTQAQDGNHYYAWAGEWCMEPYEYRGVQWISDYVQYESDCSSQQDGILLRDYWPKKTPSSSTGSISLGINQDREFDFVISYDWEIEDLEFTDNSRPSQEHCKLQWDFNHPIVGTGYDADVSYGKFAMIFNDTNKEDSYTFHHKRSAYLYARNVLGETAGGNYKTTYDFEP